MSDNTEDCPRGWVKAKVDDVGEYLNGLAFKESDWGSNGLPIIRIQNLTGSNAKFNKTARNVDSKYIVAPGTILVSWSATLDVFRWPGPRGVLNQHIFKVIPNGEVDEAYLFYGLREAINEMKESAHLHGSTMKHINRKPFLSYPFPLAPVNEQRRIVARIEALQERSRKAREALADVGPLLEQFRRSLLAAAFRGDLTADWRAAHPDTEPAAELLTRIRKERRENWELGELAKYEVKGKKPPKGWQQRYKEPELVDEDLTHDLPDGWCWATIDTTSFVTKLAGFEYTKFVKYADDGDLAVIKAENAGPFGFRYTDFSRVHSSTVEHLTRSQVQAGDVLMVFVGAGVAQVACVPDDQRYFLGPNIAMIRISSPCLRPKYLEHFLRSPVGFDLAMSFTKAVAQPSLSMGTIRKIPVPIPPIEEQERIEALIASAIERVVEGASDVADSELALNKLDQAILAKAFRGELVPQDPNDEPASVLLERIRTTRENEAATHSRKGKRKKTPETAVSKEPDSPGRPSLLNILRQADASLHVDELRTRAGLSSTDFYSLLKDEISRGDIREETGDEGKRFVVAAR